MVIAAAPPDPIRPPPLPTHVITAHEDIEDPPLNDAALPDLEDCQNILPDDPRPPELPTIVYGPVHEGLEQIDRSRHAEVQITCPDPSSAGR